MGKVVKMPGTKLSPEFVLQDALEKLPEVDSVLVALHHKGNACTVCWSNMPTSVLTFLTASIQRQMQITLDEAWEEEDAESPGRS